MPTFKKFEDIMAWQKAREVTNLIYKIIRNDEFARDLGYETRFDVLVFRSWQTLLKVLRDGRIKILLISLIFPEARPRKSSLISMLLSTQSYIEQKEFVRIYEELEEASKMIFALVKHLIR